jgi:hypothetical protein
MKLLPPPGPERRRQVLLLAVMLAGLGAVLWYQRPTTGPSSPTSNVAATTRQPLPAVQLPEAVRMGDLDAAPMETEIGRNPFSFGERPVAEPAVRFAPPPVEFSPAPVMPQGPPPIALRLSGLMVSPGSNRTMVTLKDPATGALFHAYEGDIVDGRYRIVKVGSQSAVVSYVDGSGTRTLGLGN